MVELVRPTEANLAQENILSTRPIRGIAQSSISTTPTRLESTSHLLSRILKNLREVTTLMHSGIPRALKAPATSWVAFWRISAKSAFRNLPSKRIFLWRNQAQVIASASDQRLPAKFPLSGWFSFQPAGESRSSLPEICNRGYVERVACQQWIELGRNNVTLASRWCWTVWLPHFLSKMASVVSCTQRELELPWEY